jgi:hypothetical protein
MALGGRAAAGQSEVPEAARGVKAEARPKDEHCHQEQSKSRGTRPMRTRIAVAFEAKLLSDV